MKSWAFDLESLKGNPSLVDLGVGSAWIIRDTEGNVKTVLENKCAHMGSQLRCTKSGFICDSHNWSYDALGKNDVANNPAINRLEFVIIGTEIQIFVEDNQPIFAPSNKSLDGSENLELISHATFLLETNGCNIIFDPWIKGDAYWGAWTLFPKNDFDVSRLDSVSLIVITHPHPDHFHPETLELFPRDIRIVMPGYPSRIIPRVLKKMGFTNFHEVEWEEIQSVSDKVSFAFLRPNSFWEDASVLVRVGDFIWLNQNDAGAPLNSNKVPKKIDLLTTSFDFGASGYPLTWEMDSERSARIIDNGKKQILETIRARCIELKALNYAPFAGYWRHGRAEHKKYAQALRHTTLSDLGSALDGSGTNFIPTIPSSKINLKTLHHEFSESLFVSASSEFEPSGTDLSKNDADTVTLNIEAELSRHLRQLKQMSTAARSERVTFTVRVPELGLEVSEDFGELNNFDPITIEVSVSEEIAQIVASNDPLATWNHIDIGYHGNWRREPDVYPVNFMRLLQLGYVHELSSDGSNLSNYEVLNTSVASIIEANPEMAKVILNRAGLPCAACSMTNTESLEQAIAVHRVGINQRENLIAEIKALLV